MFDDELATPEQVNGVDVALKIADVGLERGDGRATDAEHVEEFVVESLFVGTFRGCVAPITGETNRTVTHLAPREMWHGCSSARESACCVVTVLCGNSGACEMKKGTHLLASRYRHLGGPTKGRFQRAPNWGALQALSFAEIS